MEPMDIDKGRPWEVYAEQLPPREQQIVSALFLVQANVASAATQAYAVWHARQPRGAPIEAAIYYAVLPPKARAFTLAFTSPAAASAHAAMLQCDERTHAPCEVKVAGLVVGIPARLEWSEPMRTRAGHGILIPNASLREVRRVAPASWACR